MPGGLKWRTRSRVAERLQERVGELEEAVKVAKVTSSKNRRGKIDKALSNLEFAFDEKRHGPSE